MIKGVSLVVALFLATRATSAQDSVTVEAPRQPSQPRPAWLSGRDTRRAAFAVLGLGIVSLVDEPVARAIQRSSLRRNSVAQHAANSIQIAGDPGALLVSASLYIVGAATHGAGLADASLHSTEAIAVSGAITQLLKLSIGRERPSLNHDQNAFAFHPFRGYKNDYNSFPSGHTTAAFAAAAAFGEEVKRRHPGAGRMTAPALYGVAALVGAARMYNDRHWMSDVAAGALIGTFVGERIVHHAHGAH